MPWDVVKITSGKNKGKYKVVNRDTGEVEAKATTKGKAEAQRRLLYGVKSGWKPK